MAAACFNALADPGEGARAISAGTEPGARVHPEVRRGDERGRHRSLGRAAPRTSPTSSPRTPALLVTMGCGEACPVVPGLRREDWPLEDPKGKPIERVREIRDEIRGRIEDLIGREQLA